MLEKELGKKQTLTVVKQTEFGVYLGTDEERVLLPRKQVPAGTRLGDKIEVFLYRDSQDRIIATTHEPKIQLFWTGGWRRISFSPLSSRRQR